MSTSNGERDGFVQVPRRVLDDKSLSAEAIATYAILWDKADWDNHQTVSVALATIAAGLHLSKATTDSARRAVRELLDGGHIAVKEKHIGRQATFSLTHSENATGQEEEEGQHPGRKRHPTHSENTPLHKRPLDPLDINNVRKGYEETATMPSDHLLELFLDLNWVPEKIRNETARIYRTIGGRENESAFVSSVRRAMAAEKHNPFGYALTVFRRLMDVR